jgi:alkanesulfonate monooxygenase SsuD/methylene tetrahydromethanopterin reductase-like flavin-dependent oxidoreductase (luciferase family)
MRYALNLPPFRELADARILADLAREAEDAGWDGFFLWDHIQAKPGMPVADPWVALTAMAMRTERIRLGALVTPLPRRRPSKLARETATLDRLSGGRLIVGVGSGGDEFFGEYSTFGDPVDTKVRAAMLDEGLDVLTGLWSGEPFSYAGQHYTVHDARFLPTPVQAPRIPVWVAAVLPYKAPLRRAARWDGVFPIVDGRTVQPEEIRESLAYVRPLRPTDAPFDVVVAGYIGDKPAEEAEARLRSYAEAGVTWWQEGFLWKDSPEAVRARIRQGPPSIT